MNPDHTRMKEIRLTILQVLDAAGVDRAMSEEQLFAKLNLIIAPAVARAEFDDAVNWLAAVKHFIRSTPDLLDADITRWLLTEAGRNQLLQLGR
jgi:hypothetical protein